MSAPWIASTRERTSCTSTRMNASIAAPASRSAPSPRFSRRKTHLRNGSLTSLRTGTSSRAPAHPASRSARDHEPEPRGLHPGVVASGKCPQEIGQEAAGRERLLEGREVSGGGYDVTLGIGDELC